jgi:hypothetical protein
MITVSKLLANNFSSTQGVSESSGENLTNACTLQKLAQSDGSALALLENPVFKCPQQWLRNFCS